jgi:hypothetical protein
MFQVGAKLVTTPPGVGEYEEYQPEPFMIVFTSFVQVVFA